MTIPTLLASDAAAADDVPRVADFPDVPLKAEVGQGVFAPTRASLDEVKADPEHRTPSYQPATVVSVGAAVSQLSFDYAAPESVPNAYIIVIPAHTSVAAGDTLLASRYGNAMEFAAATTSNADGAALKADFVAVKLADAPRLATLEDGRYLKHDGTLRPGAFAAVKHDGARASFAVVVSVAGDKVFLAGFNGAATVAATRDVVVLEAHVALAVGDSVFAQWSSGDFVEAKVKALVPDRHAAKLEFTGLSEVRTETVPLAFITKRL